MNCVAKWLRQDTWTLHSSLHQIYDLVEGFWGLYIINPLSFQLVTLWCFWHTPFGLYPDAQGTLWHLWLVYAKACAQCDLSWHTWFMLLGLSLATKHERYLIKVRGGKKVCFGLGKDPWHLTKTYLVRIRKWLVTWFQTGRGLLGKSRGFDPSSAPSQHFVFGKNPTSLVQVLWISRRGLPICRYIRTLCVSTWHQRVNVTRLDVLPSAVTKRGFLMSRTWEWQHFF